MPNVDKPFVLLVDDNEATCTLITAVLHRDFAVEVASDGTEAIERLRTKHYAAIILDLRMPQPDGFAVLEFIEQHDRRQLRNVLVVTAALSARGSSATMKSRPVSIVYPRRKLFNDSGTPRTTSSNGLQISPPVSLRSYPLC